MKSIFAAGLMICAAAHARAKDVAYIFQGSTSGVQIEQSGQGQETPGLASGFTFDEGCTNQQQLIWVHTKGVKGMSWSSTYTDQQYLYYDFAIVVNETALTSSLYFESATYGIPLELINTGALTKTKPCQANPASAHTKSYLQRLVEARLLNHIVH
jgi:hypothetical protein